MKRIIFIYIKNENKRKRCVMQHILYLVGTKSVGTDKT